MDIRALHSAKPSSYELIAHIARVALEVFNPRFPCSAYFAALSHALYDEPPPFGTKLYTDIFYNASKNGRWLVILLMKNTEHAGEKARCLWSYAASVTDKTEKQLLKRLAIDESNDALTHLQLLDLTFPNAITTRFRKELEQLSPHYLAEQTPAPVESLRFASTPSIDDYVHMNITSLRSAIYLIMLRPALSDHSVVEHHAQMTKVLDQLLENQFNHIANTANLLEQKIASISETYLAAIFSRCLRDFLRKTGEEDIDFSYNLRFGNYP